MNVIEHQHHGDPYNADGMWHYMDAQYEFVATAAWREHVRRNGPFDGPSNHKQIIRINRAEAAALDDIRGWAQAQIDDGAEWVVIHRTWPIAAEIVPSGHRLHSKRDNAFWEAFRQDQRMMTPAQGSLLDVLAAREAQAA